VDKLERLLNLTAALLHTSRPLTAEEIRERVPGYPEGLSAFRRTFERDKDDLREMGVPLSIERIEAEERPIDGYRIHERDYYLRDPGLDPDEAAALNLAVSAVRLDGVQGVEALWKLGVRSTTTVARPSSRRSRRIPPSSRCSAPSSIDARRPSSTAGPSERPSEPSSPIASTSDEAVGTSPGSTGSPTTSACSVSTASTAPSRSVNRMRSLHPRGRPRGRPSRGSSATTTR
jgi:proteasome accessory factor B